MSRIRRAFARLRGMIGARRHDVDSLAEMHAHLEMEIEDNLRRGMDAREARRRALLAAGGVQQATERVREQRGLPALESVWSDAKYAVRQFVRTPLSTVTMVLVLSLGIGTNVVLFTVLNSLLRLPAPGIAQEETLVRIRGIMRMEQMPGMHTRPLSWPEVQAYAARTDLFSSVAAYADETAAIGAGDDESTFTAGLVYVTPNYFRVLGVQPFMGREPPRERDATRLTAPPGAMISYALWHQRFGGAPDAIGRTVRVHDVPVEIVGVAPPRFVGTEERYPLTVWLPLAAYPLIQQRTASVFVSSDSAFLSAAARLQPGVTHRAASGVVSGIAARAFRPIEGSSTTKTGDGADVAAARAGSADVVPMLSSNSRVSSEADLMISIAVSGAFALLVLLITCTNVSALLVGKAIARRREIGVRLSLGAPRLRLVRQLLTESVLLALVAAAIGIAVTMIGMRLVSATMPGMQLVVDWRVTLATCGMAILTGVLFGLSPALHATRASVGDVLKGSSATVVGSRSRLQRGLVAAQVALTQPLLVALGVMIVLVVTEMRARTTSIVPDRIVEIEMNTWAGNVPVSEQSATITDVVKRVTEMPGVLHAFPMEFGVVTVPLAVHPEDRVSGVTPDGNLEARFAAAPEGYFASFEIPIVRGRDFDADERTPVADSTGRLPTYEAAIVGKDLARRLWGDADPIGRRLYVAVRDATGSRAMVVVGVVDESPIGGGTFGQQVRVFVPFALMAGGVVARTAGPAQALLEPIRELVAEQAPRMPVGRAETMEQRVAGVRRNAVRATAGMSGIGLLALLLSAMGLYAVVALGVTQRTREIGIRTAFGARTSQVVRLLCMNGFTLSIFGVLIGLPLSVAVARIIAVRLGLPMSVSPAFGAAIGSAIAAIVLLVAAVATWVPARRASSIDPMAALRSE